jgi:hypothetical protein
MKSRCLDRMPALGLGDCHEHQGLFWRFDSK